MREVIELLLSPDNGVKHVQDSYTVKREGKLYGYCALGKLGVLSGLTPSNEESFAKALQERFPSLTPEVQAKIRDMNDNGLSFEEIARSLY